MSVWHALQVRTGSEIEIGKALQADGHQIAVPVTWRPRPISRKDKRRTWRPVAKMQGYILASPGMHARASISATEGVARVLGRNGAYDRVPASEALRVAAMSDPEPEEDPDRKEAPVYKAGQTVRITVGPLSGHVITIRAVRKGHIRSAIGKFPVEIGSEHVEAIG